MTHLNVKLLVGGLVLAGAVGYLAYAGVKSGRSYYLQVDPFLADPQYRSQRVRLHGRVDQENLSASPDGLVVSFQLLGETKTLPVVYRGAVPDLFKPGAEVVLEGQLDSSGVFQADQMLTKCASKYEAKGGQGSPAPPQAPGEAQ